MAKNKYSIILPVRNGGEYIKTCINSILSQTYPHFNLIVLDSYSTDNTLAWLKTITDERVVVIPAERPLNIEENWGRIKDISKNEFITLIGHDDVLDENYLRVMDDLIVQHPEAGLYQAHFRYIDEDENVIKNCRSMPEKETAPEFLKSFLSGNFDLMGTGFMMRAHDYDKIGGIPAYPDLMFADLELFLRLTWLSYKATASESCFSFRQHQSTTKTTSDEKLLAAFEQAIHFLAAIKNQDIGIATVINEEGKGFIHRYCISLSHRLLRIPKNNRKELSVDKIAAMCTTLAKLLVPDKDYNPLSDSKVRLAKWIDENALLSLLFLYFKKIFSKPIYV